MKLINIRNFILAVILLFMAACTKEQLPGTKDLHGEWSLVFWSGSDGADMLPEDISVYVSFRQDGSFDIYEKLGDVKYEHSSGTYTVADGILYGRYDDGGSMRTEYKISIYDDGQTLETVSSASGEICRYTRSSIPDDVIGNAVETKASVRASIPFL